MSTVLDNSLSLVPPARFGALLSARRREAGLEVAEMVIRSYGEFSAAELETFERGNAKLEDWTIQRLAPLYQLDAGPLVPVRSTLIIDLDQGSIQTGDATTNLEKSSPAEIIDRYLALVYAMRDLTPGRPIDLRIADVQILSDVLGWGFAAVEAELAIAMNRASVLHWSTRFKKRISVPGIGLLVGFTSMGALVLVPGVAAIPDAIQPSSPTFLSSSLAKTPSTPTLVSAQELTAPGPTIEKPATSSPTDQSTTSQKPATSTGPDSKGTEGAPSPTQRAAAKSSATQSSATQAPPPTAAPPTTQAPPPTAAPPTTQAPPPTAAPPTQAPAPKPNHQQLGEQALNLISYNWRAKLPGWAVAFHGDRPGYRGLTYRDNKRVEIYIDAGDSPYGVAEILAHELAHAIDLEYLDDNQRLAWLNARGMPQVWWAGDGLNDFQVGQGDFAEAVAALWVKSASKSGYGDFSSAQLQLLQSMLP